MSPVLEKQLPSRIESVEAAADVAGEFARANGLGDELAYAMDLAVRESVANAVKHGNKLDESKVVELRIEEGSGTLTISVRDFGNGFALDEIPDPTDPENLLKTNGRGILFMRSFMDTVEWTEADGGGTVVIMTKSKA